jgi:hypothetical protein
MQLHKLQMVAAHLLRELRDAAFTDVGVATSVAARRRSTQAGFADALKRFFDDDGGFVNSMLQWSLQRPEHVMKATPTALLTSLFALLRAAAARVMEFNDGGGVVTVAGDALGAYAAKSLVHAVVWSFGGPLSLVARTALCKELSAVTAVPLPQLCDGESILDYEVRCHVFFFVFLPHVAVCVFCFLPFVCGFI